MRRSRIKAMATVPARRKPIRDVKEEISLDPAKPAPTEVSVEKTEVPIVVVSPKESEQTAIEVPKSEPLEPTNNDSTSPERPATDQPTAPATVVESESESVAEPVEKKCKLAETTIERSISPKKPDAVADNSEASTHDDPKTSSNNVDAPSTTKTSQTRTSFMRPIPRLDAGVRIRRNSVQGSGASASESEDDARRSTSAFPNRVKQDSTIAAITSPKKRVKTGNCENDGTTTTTTTTRTTIDDDNPMNFFSLSNPPRKRRNVISESSRKLAEARREFMLKHDNKPPDKSKIRMYDLIYWNPTTNPMKKVDNPGGTAGQKTSSSVITMESEDEDDVNDEPAESVPVPQVKIGPDGSVVIDEQSLVIEHTGAKKNRQALARTEALIDENLNGSGFYKKRQKNKEWPNWETLRFYTSLNTVGTDFLLMESFFPKRSRRELKLKFKKEERMNPRLIEKVITNHQEFDVEWLKGKLETMDKEQVELEKKMETQPVRRKRGTKPPKKTKAWRMAEAIAEMEKLCERENSTETEVIDAPSIAASSTASSNDSDSDVEIYQVKPTRSGRHPKVRKLQAPRINTLDNKLSIDDDPNEDDGDDEDDIDDSQPDETKRSTSEKNHKNSSANTKKTEKTEKSVAKKIVKSDVDVSSWKSSENLQNSLSGITQVEPGSLVIVSRESTDEPGETVLQVYMVSSDHDNVNGGRQNMTPIVLTPELLNTVTAGITKVTPIDVKPE